jgi:hypothetical protein
MEATEKNRLTELVALGKALAPKKGLRSIHRPVESLYEEPLAEVEAAWDVEVERRLAAYDCGQVRAIDGEVVLAQASLIAQR